MLKLVTAIVVVFLVFSHRNLQASVTDPPCDSLLACDSVCDTTFICQTESSRSDSVKEQTGNESFRKKKLITSILAFPIPFGFIGLHRIYLGTSPWVPIAYLCTGGGGLGLLPLIDFCYIITADEEEFKKYENNPGFFMFVD